MNMIELRPEDFLVRPDTGEDMTLAVRALFQKATDTKGEKHIEFLPGIYDFYPETAERPVMYISNTVAEKEMKVPVRTVPLRISDAENVTINAEGAEFLMHGAMTNFVVERCKNFVLKGAAFDHVHPAVAEVTVTEKRGCRAVYLANPDCQYKMGNGRPVFYGENFECDTAKNALTQWANVRLSAEEPDKILRWRHPLIGVRKFVDLGGNRFEAKYWGCPKVKVGDRYALHDTTRREVGIYVGNSENVVFDGVKQYFGMSLTYAVQMTKNISLLNCYSAPRAGSPRFTSAQADFCHFSMCSGKVTVKNTVFEGAFDDIVNVHGFHFKTLAVEVDTIEVSFMHPQAYGFLPFEEGDVIEFITPSTLVPTGKTAVVQSAKMRDNYVVSLVLDRAVSEDVSVGTMVENITKCAELEYSGNTARLVTTRGILCTTRGKVLIENNDFYKLGMSGILISDDAKGWFESGCVRDVTIRNNRFTKCGGQAVLVLPEYQSFDKPVHENIVIEENDIIVSGERAIRLKGTKNVIVRKNNISGEPGRDGYIVQKDCENVKISENIMKA